MKKLTTNKVVYILVFLLNMIVFAALSWVILTKSETDNVGFLSWLVGITAISTFTSIRFFPIDEKTLFDIDAKYSLNEGEDEEIKDQIHEEILSRHKQNLENAEVVKRGISDLKVENGELKEKIRELELCSMFPEKLNQISIGL